MPARQTVWRETPKVLATADWDCPLRRSSRMAAVWSGAEGPVLHGVAGLRPTRRVKRPAHPDGHRCGVPQFAGVLSVQGPDALHNGGRFGAAPYTLVDDKAGKDVAEGREARAGALSVLVTGSSPDRPSPPLYGRHANAPLHDCHITDASPLRQPVT